MNDKEQKLVKTHRECLAAIWAVTLPRPYLEESRFIIKTNREVLRHILTIAKATGKLARWRLRLSEFEFDIVYRVGMKHQAADTLSCLKTGGDQYTPLGNEVLVLTIFTKCLAYVPSTAKPELETI